jgi:hypothetical protein
MDITYNFLAGPWRLQKWIAKQIIHSPEEDLEMIHEPDGILEEEHEIKIYNIWEDYSRSNVVQQLFLQSFKNEEEMKQTQINFTTDNAFPPWHSIEVRGNSTGEVIKKGYWQIDDYRPNSVNLSVWDYNISLKIKILSDHQILLKEVFEGNEMESDTHEIIMEKLM